LAPRTIKLIHHVMHRALGQAKLWGSFEAIRRSWSNRLKRPIERLRCCSRITRPCCWSVSAAGLSTCLRPSPWPQACGATRCWRYVGAT
jgi:hypothetical protein